MGSMPNSSAADTIIGNTVTLWQPMSAEMTETKRVRSSRSLLLGTLSNAKFS